MARKSTFGTHLCCLRSITGCTGPKRLQLAPSRYRVLGVSYGTQEYVTRQQHGMASYAVRRAAVALSDPQAPFQHANTDETRTANER